MLNFKEVIMHSREKKIIELLKKGKMIYDIPEACVFRTDKPSKTEPGQALSVAAHVKLASAGLGSLGMTDDMFDFDDSLTVEEAVYRSASTLAPAGVSSLHDLIERRVALYEAAARARQKAGGRAAGGGTPPPPVTVSPREADSAPVSAADGSAV
jgi:hypothetical protein